MRRYNPRLFGGFLAIVVVALFALFGNVDPSALPALGTPTFSPLPSSARISVTDGDTIKVGGQAVRLVGFNTPETYEPACAHEAELGARATRRLKQLVAGGDVDFARVPCSCPPGTEGTAACNYGRSCGILRVDGKDAGGVLIAEGLAVPYRCNARSCPPPPRPWCG